MLSFLISKADDTIQVHIQLRHSNNHSPQVIIHLPEWNMQKLRIIFPSFVPGSFTEVAPGNLIKNLAVFGKDRQTLPFKRIAINTFEIFQAAHAQTISYHFQYSWEVPLSEHGFFPQLGSAVKNDNFILLNFGTFLPFIEGKEKNPIKIFIEKDAVYNGFSPLTKNKPGINSEIYYARNYLHLVDNPIVLTTGYESTFKSGNTVFHCVSNTYGKLSEKMLLQTLKPVCDGVIKFCKSLNSKDYYFFIFLVDSGDVRGKLDAEDYGAVQHSSSSVMVFKNDTDSYKIQKEIQQTASHELFHLFEPLNLKTDVTSKLNVKSKLPTQHLWLFEGVTEYFSLLMQWRENLITQSEFIHEIRNKMSLMQFYEPFPLAQKSEESILSGNETYYRNFYYKGCLAAMMLDLRLLELSQGQLNLQELLMRFKRSMSDNYVVKDEELIRELVKISSFQELNEFFDNHIYNTAPFDFNKYLSLIGWVHEAVREDTSKMYLNASFRYVKGSKNVYLTNINIDQLGFQEGDVLLKINHKRVYKDNVEELMEKVSSVNHKNATFTIRRKGKEIKLTGKPLIVNKSQRNVIKVEKRPTPEKQFYRNAFKNGQLSTGRPYRMLN
jgi:predicted metalloprotease with PDZ domain